VRREKRAERSEQREARNGKSETGLAAGARPIGQHPAESLMQ
jgi:hypothetical protein